MSWSYRSAVEAGSRRSEEPELAQGRREKLSSKFLRPITRATKRLGSRSLLFARREAPSGIGPKKRVRQYGSLAMGYSLVLGLLVAVSILTLNKPVEGPIHAALASSITSWGDQLVGTSLKAIACPDQYHCITVGEDGSGNSFSLASR